MKGNVFRVALATCMLVALVLALPSCGILKGSESKAVGIVSAQINDAGELVLTYSDGTEQNLGTVVGKDGSDGTNGADGQDGQDGQDGIGGGQSSSVEITVQGGGNVAVASAKALRSAVSIVCNFKATVQQGGWRPGSSSTTTKEYSSEGSGVIYWLDKQSGDAFIITNYHVVYDASSNTDNGISEDISVYLYGAELEEQAIAATYVGGSLYYDIAVLRVEDSVPLKQSDACAADAANSDKVVVGDCAIAVGNAQGLGISSTSGIVSVDSEYITMTAADERTSVSFRVLRVDTAINSGNSGGGLYNDRGELIGIVNAKIVYDGVENIGYAIPSNVAVSIAENIIHYCYGTDTERVQRALLGITVSATDSRAVYDAESGLISIRETVSVYEVNEGSLADGVLQAGDVLVSVTLDGQTTDITRQYHIIDMMLDVRAGDVVTLRILRDGEQQEVSITVTEECLTAY